MDSRWTVEGLEVSVSEHGIPMPSATTVRNLLMLVEAKKSLGVGRHNIFCLDVRMVGSLERLIRRIRRYPVLNCIADKTPLLMISVGFHNPDGDERYYNDLMGWCPNCRSLHFAALPDDN